MSAMTYRRVIIKGTLTTTTALHIGTGELGENPENKVSYNTIVLDAQHNPYIPGSSLRGLLASQLIESEQKKHWFGDARQRSDAETQGKMGALRIYDAVSSSANTHFMSRTSIEPTTQAAKHHHLATHHLVDAGTTFTLEIGFDTWSASAPIKTQDIESLLGLLERLNGAQMGTGKSVGQGILTWKLDTVSGLSTDAYQHWLGHNWVVSNAIQPLNSAFKLIQGLSPSACEALLAEVWTTQAFTLRPLSPILINNPFDPELKSEEQGAPKQVFLKQGHTAIIPASTLKGWFRAHCRRILLTLLQHHTQVNDEVCEYVDRQLLDALWGGTDTGEGHIRFYDATVNFMDQDQHLQTFNAVDRFTGGVKEGALYTAKALWIETPFKASLHFRETKLEGWMKLLLLFVWRDAAEGDLVLGWGKSKGYGKLMLQAEDEHWKQWLDDPELVAWEQELMNKLQGATA